MRPESRSLVCALLLAILGSAGCQPYSGSSETHSKVLADTESIRAEAEAWYRAIERKDLEKTLSFYATDAKYLSAGRAAATTPDARRKLWAEDYATPGFSSEEKTSTIDVAESGDLAYQMGTYVSSVRNEQGEIKRSTGKFVVIWKREPDSTWKAIVDIDNADE